MGKLNGTNEFVLKDEETAFIWKEAGKIEAVIPHYEDQSVIQPDSPTFWCLITCALFSNQPDWLDLRKRAVELFLQQLHQHNEENPDGAGQEEVQSGQEEAPTGAALPDSSGPAEAGDADAEAPDDGEVPEESGPA